MHANCSSLLSRLKCTCVRACVCVQGELGSGAMAVMWKMKLVFAVLLVSSQSSSERESRGVGEKMHACPPPTHTVKGVASENIMAPYGIHGMRTSTHPYVIHCHLSKSIRRRNPFQLGSCFSALHVDVDESIQKPHC